MSKKEKLELTNNIINFRLLRLKLTIIKKKQDLKVLSKNKILLLIILEVQNQKMILDNSLQYFAISFYIQLYIKLS